MRQLFVEIMVENLLYLNDLRYAIIQRRTAFNQKEMYICVSFLLLVKTLSEPYLLRLERFTGDKRRGYVSGSGSVSQKRLRDRCHRVTRGGSFRIIDRPCDRFYDLCNPMVFRRCNNP